MTGRQIETVRPSVALGRFLVLLVVAVAFAVALYALLEGAGGWR